MSKKNILSLIIILGITVLIGGFIVFNNKHSTSSISIHGKVFKLEIVSSSQDKERGLGGRNSICDDCGMLFVFNAPGKYSFWMKDMLFAIDILWILNDKVVFIEKNVSPSLIGTVVSTDKADRVLEINAGAADGAGIEIGDSVLMR